MSKTTWDVIDVYDDIVNCKFLKGINGDMFTWCIKRNNFIKIHPFFGSKVQSKTFSFFLLWNSFRLKTLRFRFHFNQGYTHRKKPSTQVFHLYLILISNFIFLNTTFWYFILASPQQIFVQLLIFLNFYFCLININ